MNGGRKQQMFYANQRQQKVRTYGRILIHSINHNSIYKISLWVHSILLYKTKKMNTKELAMYSKLHKSMRREYTKSQTQYIQELDRKKT